jgi:hypothetical protein
VSEPKSGKPAARRDSRGRYRSTSACCKEAAQLGSVCGAHLFRNDYLNAAEKAAGSNKERA